MAIQYTGTVFTRMTLSWKARRRSITTCNVWKADSVRCRSKAAELPRIYSLQKMMSHLRRRRDMHHILHPHIILH
jgi:hypothetical protein